MIIGFCFIHWQHYEKLTNNLKLASNSHRTDLVLGMIYNHFWTQDLKIKVRKMDPLYNTIPTLSVASDIFTL